MNAINDTVKFNHSEITGIGIITKFHNDKCNGVQIKIIEATRKSTGKAIKPNQKFNCLQKDIVEIIKKHEYESKMIIEHDTLMAELFASEERRDEIIGVVTPEFVGRWR